MMGFTPVVIQPESRINMSAWSDSILLVDVTKVTFTDEKTGDGLGCREITVEGTVVEVIRGKKVDLKFSASQSLTRVVDWKEAVAKRGEFTAELIAMSKNSSGGIEDCTAGRRYVVIYPSSEFSIRGQLFFAEVAQDHDDWRKRILPCKHLDDNEPPIEHDGHGKGAAHPENSPARSGESTKP